MKNYYQILGIAPQASVAEVRKAFRSLAATCHPDRHPGDKRAEERFKDLSEAYGVLTDPEKRSRYDRLRPNAPKERRGFEAQKNRGPGPKPFQKPASPKENFKERVYQRPQAASNAKTVPPKPDVPVKKNDKKSSFWSSVKRFLGELGENLGILKVEPLRPWDLKYELAISQEAAAMGTEIKFRYQPNPQQDSKELLVKIPAGIKDKATLRLTGQGQTAPDGQRGDLILTILVAGFSV